MSVNLDPNLKTNDALEYTPPPKLTLTYLRPLPDGWINELGDLCAEYQKAHFPNSTIDLRQQLNDKIDDGSGYPLKDKLREQLKIVYYRLKGDLDPVVCEF